MGLGNLNLPDNVEAEGDVLPGGNFELFNTGVYDMRIKLAYTLESSGGATGVHLRLVDKDDREHRETIYITSGRAKGQKTTYTDRNGKERPLPGYSQINELALCATGKGIAQQDEEKKTVKLWDRDAQAEVPQEVPVIMSLVGKNVKVGLVKASANKQVNNNGKWEDGPDRRDFNEIQKFFNEDGLTSVEITGGKKEGEFLARWEEKFPADYVNDTFKPVAAPAAAEPAIPASAPPADDDIFGD